MQQQTSSKLTIPPKRKLFAGCPQEFVFMLLSFSKTDTEGLKLFKVYVFIVKTLRILRKTPLFQKEVFSLLSNSVTSE